MVSALTEVTAPSAVGAGGLRMDGVLTHCCIITSIRRGLTVFMFLKRIRDGGNRVRCNLLLSLRAVRVKRVELLLW